MSKKDVQNDAQGRLVKILRGAFANAPTPLKNIPKKRASPVAKAKRKKATEKLVKKLDKGPLF